ncbi:hypothetical protein [Bradyrhizobium sp.]|uniref:hypothetical protein n=1 Tax=Bradyrhizobium sp. TaxID=376 RepID=UPI0007C976CC|nr:hypothetical protein [Bradyrhizobium sp.]
MDESDGYYQRIDANQAKLCIENSLAAFAYWETWGPDGVLHQGDIIFAAQKRLHPRDMNYFANQLMRRYEVLDLQFLAELGRRRVRASSTLPRLDASAQLYALTQPAQTFDRFLAIASQQNQMIAEALRSAIVEASTFPRSEWIGSAVHG